MNESAEGFFFRESVSVESEFEFVEAWVIEIKGALTVLRLIISLRVQRAVEP